MADSLLVIKRPSQAIRSRVRKFAQRGVALGSTLQRFTDQPALRDCVET
ncbi:hypothetical protein CZ674_11235 [Agrococcus casei LMG 22410]|uniref:Uncharacterized protein n=1 Tax=Agrococcus casei LMG 22410 TaxID=1255656 RepID=A0A1R4GEC0_9MICO|nr:hypothetical protein CZ674_11235 [Agrococcus casei LMG 22410]